ncbi:MAG: hypothetical protein ACXV74_01760 [Methylobacter sp.]
MNLETNQANVNTSLHFFVYQSHEKLKTEVMPSSFWVPTIKETRCLG